MKQTLIAGVALVALGSGFAGAADLPAAPAPMAPVVAPVWTWTGFYIGANIGGIWNNSEYSVSPTGCFVDPTVMCGGALTNNALRSDVGKLNNNNNNNVGFTGGGQLGFNWQLGALVLGFETDINGTNLNANDSVNRALAAPLVGNFLHTVDEKLDWYGTVRGRIGVLPVHELLLYVTGGLAYGRLSSNTAVSFSTTTDAYAGAFSDTRVGWTAGGGAEWAFSPNWSAKIEYLYVDLGSITYADICTTAVCALFVPLPGYQTDLKTRENIVRFGINYRFGGPVVAKY